MNASKKPRGGSPMRWRILDLAVLLLLVAARQAGAQTGDALHPCKLLTTAQVTAAVGAVGATQEGDMPGSGRGANPLRRVCAWGMTAGTFYLSVGKVPNPTMSTRELLDYMNTMYEALKGQGWKYEKKDFGSTSCSFLTPPPGDANSQFATICGTVVKGMLVMTSASSKPSVPMEKLKTLAESAAARLP
jgi:hypothetical protein